MIRARIGIALSLLSALGVLPAGCHKAARVQRNGDVAPVIKDSARVVEPLTDPSVVAPLTDPSVIALFKDTAGTSVFPSEGQIFKLQTPAHRQSLRARIRKERQLWQAGKPRDYRYLLRVGCFCPGTRGWLLMEVRSGQPLRALDRTGKSVGLTDWNTVSIEWPVRQSRTISRYQRRGSDRFRPSLAFSQVRPYRRVAGTRLLVDN